jgi:biotin carboxylase
VALPETLLYGETENRYRLLVRERPTGGLVGHLLMVESWVGSMSTLLPRGIREGGHRFSFVTRDLHHYLRATTAPNAHPLLGADNILTTETNDEDALVRYLGEVHEVLRFDGVLTSCDYYLPVVAAVAEEFGLTGPGHESVVAACRKDRTRQVLADSGVPGPRFAVESQWPAIEHAAAGIGYPLVVKPVDLCGGMFVRRVEDVEQLRAAVQDIAGFPVNARGQQRQAQVLLEELLVGPEFSVETVTRAGRTTVVGVTDKSIGGEPWFVETGHMFPAAIDPTLAGAVSDLAGAAIRALGLDNTVAHTEVKVTAAGPRLVEVNPRPAGNQITELVRRVTGVDLAAVHAEVALGREPDLRPANTGVGSAAIAFLLPPRAGLVEDVRGTAGLADAPGVVAHTVVSGRRSVQEVRNNNTYLGHVMVVDERAGAARPVADGLIAGLEIRYSDEKSAA